MKQKNKALTTPSAKGTRRLQSGCLAATIMLAMALSPPPLVAAEANYDHLVSQARAGDTAPLLFWLQDNAAELNANMRADWLQVANWAGDDRQVIAVWESLSPAVRRTIPVRGALAAASSYRNLKQWQPSLAIWHEQMRLNPELPDARAGWIMSLADAGEKHQARQQAERFVQEDGSYLSHQVLLYTIQGSGNGWDELFALTRLQDLHQDAAQSEINNKLMQVMAAKLVSKPALQFGQQHTADAATLRRLELDQTAEMVRMAHTDSRGEHEQYNVPDRAIARYQQLLQSWQGQKEADNAAEAAALKADIRRARIDRLGAYLARHRYQDVIKDYESLQQQDPVLPVYAQRWAASAYLSNRQPDQAYDILHRQFAATPTSKLAPEDAQELFFAALESDRIDEAGQIASDIMANAPYQRYYYGSPTPQPNDNWLSGQVLHGHYLQALNRLDEAELHNQKLSDGGPGNQGLRINLAETLLARGLPRAAERQLKVSEVLEPGNLMLERQQAYVAQGLQEWRQFDLLVEDVVERSPELPATELLARTHQVENMSELRLGGRKGISSDNPVSGSHDMNLTSALYGPRMYEHWRPFIGFDYAAGRFDEGKGSERIYAVGTEFSSRDNWAEVEVSNHNAESDNKMGGRFSYWHDINDNWRLGTDVERLARSTPLRAIRSGVTSNQVDGFVRWYQSESRQYQVSVAASDFSDGNNRFNAAITGQERLYSGPSLIIDLLPTIAMSSNSQTDGAYYSPKQDLSIAPTLFADHVLYRRYDQIWSQQLVLGAGYYWQQDQDGGLSTTAGYGQRYATSQVFDAGAMLLWNKQPYDGKREHDLSLLFDVNFRF